MIPRCFKGFSLKVLDTFSLTFGSIKVNIQLTLLGAFMYRHRILPGWQVDIISSSIVSGFSKGFPIVNEHS